MLTAHNTKTEVRVAFLLYEAEKLVGELFDDCIPNKLFRNRESGLPFPVFSKTMHMFEKRKMLEIPAGVLVHIV